MKKRLKEVTLIREHKPPESDCNVRRSISYSQLQMYSTCPHQWALSYVEKLKLFTPSLNLVFGTSFHETVQEWLTELYEGTVKKAMEMDLQALLQRKMRTVYSLEKEKYGQHFTTAQQLSEFYDDGVQILAYLRRRRAEYFSSKSMYLAGIETPIVYPIAPNVYFKGYVDVILYNQVSNRYTIIDIKTSTSGWNANAKKDDKKIYQLLLYKEFVAKQFNIDVDSIDVKYIIVKRKVPADPDYPAMGKRVQEFSPASGKIKRGQALTKLNEFIADAFNNDGQYIVKQYTKNPSKSNCMFCPYRNTPHCDSSF